MDSIDVVGRGLTTGPVTEVEVLDLAAQIFSSVTSRAVGAFFMDGSRLCCGCTVAIGTEATHTDWIPHVHRQGQRMEAESAILVRYTDGRAAIERVMHLGTRPSAGI